MFYCDGARRSPPVCNYESAKRWLGPCPGCGGLHHAVQRKPVDGDRVRISLADLAVKPVELISTGIRELDTILGGGFVPGSPLLVVGPAGLGKSTLLLQAADGIAKGSRSVLYTSGEQSRDDIGLYAHRLGIKNAKVDVLGNEADVYRIVSEAQKVRPALVVVDSVQTAIADAAGGDVGSVEQVKAVANYLVSFAKEERIALLMVCHVNATGAMAGPEALRHLVDVIIHFDKLVVYDKDGEIDEGTSLRVISCPDKNRFGPTGVRAVLEMTEGGLRTPAKSVSRWLST